MLSPMSSWRPRLLMLPNVVPLWETLLAAMKLGVVLPTTTQPGGADLEGRSSSP